MSKTIKKAIQSMANLVTPRRSKSHAATTAHGRPEMTLRQSQILDFIRLYHAKNKFMPSMIEICDEFDFSLRAAQNHLERLERMKYIQRKSNIARGIVILD